MKLPAVARVWPGLTARWGWVLPVSLFLALTLPTIGRAGISWDEQTDLGVARSYLSGPGEWLRGSDDDPTQTRLPMYVVGLVFRLVGTETLHTARIVSCVVGVLVLLGVYVYARWQLNPATALMASTLLSVNPFFLAFARVAFTESDVYVAAAMIWLLYAAARMAHHRTVGWAALAGLALGLAMSAKFLAVSMLPVIAIAPWLPAWSRGPEETRLATGEDVRVAAMLAGVWVFLALLVGGFYAFRPQPSADYLAMTTAYGAALIAASWVARYLMCRRERVASPVTLSVIAVGVAGAVFVLIPPVHLTQSVILGSLKNEVLLSAPIDPSFMVHASVLHVLSTLIKPGPLLGIALWTALVVSLFRARTEPWLRLPVLMSLGYLAFLIKMNVAQTFYTIPILPLLTVLCAEQWTRWHRRRRWVAVPIAAACVLTTVDIARSYPDYQLNGYQWLGARYIGTVPTLAYRGVAQLTTDGLQQSLEWVNENVPDGAVVRTYSYARHIVRAISPSPRFDLVDGLLEGGDIVGANYVVTTLLSEVGRPLRPEAPQAPFVSRPYDRERLLRHFEKVYSVNRAFDLEVAAVWRRHADADPSANGAGAR